MKSHIKTVESYEQLVRLCTGFGGNYNPGSPNLQISAMTALLTEARQALDEMRSAKNNFDDAINTRAAKFKEMQKLCPRIIRVLKSSGASALTVEDAKGYVRKMNGKALPPLPSTDGETSKSVKPRTRTARGLDYGTRAEHFAKLVETVTSTAGYQPNEPELSVSGLKKYVAELQSMNNAVKEAYVRFTQARSSRKSTFYTKTNNLVQTAHAAKNYLRGVFPFTSPEVSAISKLSFTKNLK